jgi:hypothetical protein
VDPSTVTVCSDPSTTAAHWIDDDEPLLGLQAPLAAAVAAATPTPPAISPHVRTRGRRSAQRFMTPEFTIRSLTA